jgi:hypothetical protein
MSDPYAEQNNDVAIEAAHLEPYEYESPPHGSSHEDDEYLYHATPKINYEAISKEGLRTNQEPVAVSEANKDHLAGNIYLTEKSELPSWMDYFHSVQVDSAGDVSWEKQEEANELQGQLQNHEEGSDEHTSLASKIAAVKAEQEHYENLEKAEYYDETVSVFRVPKALVQQSLTKDTGPKNVSKAYKFNRNVYAGQSSDMKSFRDAADQYAYWDGSPLEGRAAELQKPDPSQRAQKESLPASVADSDFDNDADKPTQPDPAMGINKATGQPRVASKQPKPAPLPDTRTIQQQMEDDYEAEKAEKRFQDMPEREVKQLAPIQIRPNAGKTLESFRDAVDAAAKDPANQESTGPPPVEPEAWNPDEYTDPRHAAADLHTKGEQIGQDRFLEVAGVYEGSPQQISQFAKLLGLELWGAIQTPEQLTGAIEYAGAEARERLNEILRHNGLMVAKQSEPSQVTFSEQAGKALGDFTGGLRDGTGIGLARKMLGAAGRPIGKAIASEVTRTRNQADDKYQGEYPGYMPGKVNVIQPPKASGPGPVFTAKKNNPDADFWIARRGSSKTVGKPHREFAPESIGISVNREHMDPGYVWHVMDALHQTGHWAGKATGTTNLVNINNGHIKELLGMDVFQPAPKEPGPPVEGPIPPLPKEKPAEQSYGEKEVENVKESYSAFSEADHPRDSSGKFTDGPAGSGSSLKPGDKITTKRKMTYANPGYAQSDKEVNREIETVEPGKNPDKCKVKFVGSSTKYTYNKKTGLLRALNDQMTEHRVVEEEQPGIVMPSDDVGNEDANEGDQLGLFGEGKKKKVPKQYKQENPQGKARVKSLFDKDEDPDQQTLFSSFGEAVSYYSTTR